MDATISFKLTQDNITRFSIATGAVGAIYALVANQAPLTHHLTYAAITAITVIAANTLRSVTTTVATTTHTTTNAQAPPAQPPPQTHLASLATVAAEFGKGVLAAIQPAGGTNIASALGIQQQAATAAGKTYDAYQYAVIQGFSNSPTQAGLQPIWGLFTQTKNVDTIRLHIKIAMKRWARQHAVNIHKGLLLPKTTIESIRDMHFNPGGGVAYFASAEKGISILACQPTAGESRDLAKAAELAQEISTASRTLAEALDLGKHDPSPPPGNYQDLKATVGTFCGLLAGM